MSELHSYLLSWGDPSRATIVRAFTAADALTQLKSAKPWDCAPACPVKVEPLPDSPSVPDERAEAQRQGDEQARRLNELAAERGRRQAAEAECNRIRAELHIVTEQRDGAREALGASDRELREARSGAERLRLEKGEERKRVGILHDRLVDTVKERDRLSAERDALQKRIEAALERLRISHQYKAGDAFVVELCAILEGRTPTTEGGPRNRPAVHMPLIAFTDRLAAVAGARPVRVGVRLDPASWEAFLAEARVMARSDRADGPPLSDCGPIRMPTAGGEVVIEPEGTP